MPADRGQGVGAGAAAGAHLALQHAGALRVLLQLRLHRGTGHLIDLADLHISIDILSLIVPVFMGANSLNQYY